MLTIERYNDAEMTAQSMMGLRTLQAYSPATFEELGYPVRVSKEKLLLRYVDTMHETFDGKYFDPSFMRYSVSEGKTISKISQRVADVTLQNYGRTIRPWMAPFGAVQAYRTVVGVIEALEISNPRIFEIGPGSGYLGAFLIDRGYQYASMDNTQAFYLWQNRLYEALAGDEFEDWADNGKGLENWNKQVGHMAWWQWAQMSKTSNLKADIVICDHALGEFHPIALRHALRVVRHILSGEKGPKMFLFTSPGREHFSDLNTIGRTCKQSGLLPVFFDGFYGFTVEESICSKWANDQDHQFKTHAIHQDKHVSDPIRSRLDGAPLAALEQEVMPVDFNEDEEMLSGGSIIKVRKEEAPLDYAFLEMGGYKTPLDFS